MPSAASGSAFAVAGGPYTVVIADDHPVVLEGLGRFFERASEFRLVARCGDGEAALAAARLHRPDVVVLDLDMPERDGVSVLEAIRHEGIPCRVLILTGAIETVQLQRALQSGVDGVVLKEAGPQVLTTAIRRALAGERWVDSRAATVALGGVNHPVQSVRNAPVLTPREVDVVVCVARGMTNEAVARHLGIGIGTVKTHLHSIYQKLALRDRLQLVFYAQVKGLP